jgi:hypothetical protein
MKEEISTILRHGPRVGGGKNKNAAVLKSFYYSYYT